MTSRGHVGRAGAEDVGRIPARVFISYAHDDAAHEDRVRDFYRFLRAHGVDAQADITAAERRQDWPEWMNRELCDASHVLVIASPEYKRRAEGDVDPGEGRGVQWEAALIRQQLYADQKTGLRRFLPVVLPGCSADDIPLWLFPFAATHYQVSEYTRAGAEKLLRLLTGQPWETEPPLGAVPVLPPRDQSASVSLPPGTAAGPDAEICGPPGKARGGDVAPGQHAELSQSLTCWTGNAIVIDPGAALWQATVKHRSAMGTHIIRFSLTDPVQQSICYNPLSEIRRRTPDELADFTEIVRLLINDPSERGEATASLLLAVAARYMDDTNGPSLHGLAQFVGEPSFYTGMQLLSYLSDVRDPTRPGHLFAATVADELQLYDEGFAESMFADIRAALSVFTEPPLADRIRRHSFWLYELLSPQEPSTIYVTFRQKDIERLRPFIRLVCAQFARGLRNRTSPATMLIAFAGAETLGPNALMDIARSPIEGVKLAIPPHDRVDSNLPCRP